MERDRRRGVGGGSSLSANAMKFKTVPHDACAPARTLHKHARAELSAQTHIEKSKCTREEHTHILI